MVQLPKNIDVSKLRYSEMKTLSSGAKTVYVNYGSEKLTIQTPVMSLPYGLGEPYEAKDAVKNGSTLSDKEKKYDLTTSFRGIDENPKVKIFHDKLKEIETKIIDDAFENRLAWFKDDFDGNKSFVSKLFSPFVRVDKDPNTGKPVGKYPPTFKAKLPYDVKTNSFAFDTYDMDNNELNFSEIMTNLKGAKAQLIVQLSGIWFAGGKYGCSWKIVSAKFQLYQYSKITFIEDSDTEDIVNDEDEDDVVNSEVLSNLNVPVKEEDEDEEDEADEAEEEDEDIPTPEPSPPPKKPTKKGAKK